MTTSDIKLYEPINTLKAVNENIWIVDGSIAHMRAYGTAIPFPTRMTVIKLKNDDLFLHSPIQLTLGLKAEIDALGTVRHLISPNKLHYEFIPEWSKHYPAALRWASPGVQQRAEQMKISVVFDRDLGETPNPAWADEIDQTIVHGSRFLHEVVFFHKSSRTLILADLIENFEREKIGRFLGLLAKLGGALDPDGKAPLDI